MLSSILSKVNSKNKEFVGISLSPNGSLELIQVNRIDKTIQKYTNRFVNYNAITREIESYDAFRNEIESGFDALGLNPKDCNVVLSMPNVLFGINDSLPSLLNDPSQIAEALTSDVMEAYIFKREEPIISWANLSSMGDYQKIAYTAIQESAIKEIKEVFESLGATLVSIQNTLSTLIGGLTFSGKLTNFIPKDSQYWNLVVITGTSLSVFNFNESTLENYYEEPLAVKSYNESEVYTAVATVASSALQSFPGSRILIISETDDISAEVMATKISGETYYIEQNKFQQAPILETSLDVLPNLSAQISISAVGAAVDYADSNPLKFNYLETADGFKTVETPDIVTIAGKSFELTTEKAKNYTILTIIILAIFFGVIYGGFTLLTNNIQSEVNKLANKEQQLQTELKQYSQRPKQKAHIATSINAITESNRKKMLYYDALSYGIPDKLWLEYFEISSAGQVAINGVAMSSGDITAFLKGIREVAGESNVSLSKLSIINEEDILNFNGQDLYSFQLSTGSFSRDNFLGNDSEDNGSQKNKKYKRNNTPPANLPSLAPPVRIFNN